MQAGPTIIGLFHIDVNHDPNLFHAASNKIENYLKKRKKKGTIFIEGNTQVIKSIKTAITRGEIERKNPFQTAIIQALKSGWTIKPLDKKRSYDYTLSKLDPKTPDFYEQQLGYKNKNIRERQWAHKIAYAKTTTNPNDIIIMHPNHVWGFIAECAKKGIHFQKIVFLSPLGKITGPKRLNQQQMRELRTIRNAKRIELLAKRKITSKIKQKTR